MYLCITLNHNLTIRHTNLSNFVIICQILFHEPRRKEYHATFNGVIKVLLMKLPFLNVLWGSNVMMNNLFIMISSQEKFLINN